MATMQERLALLISADVDQAVRGLGKLEKTSDRAIGKSTERVDRMGHSLTKMGAGMLSVGALAGVGLVKAAGAASDLNEAINVTEQIFGDAEAEIREFAKTASASMGQSERAALEATSQFGGLLQNMGLASGETVEWSKTLTLLASDLGSMFNSEPAEAAMALGSALRGESEPIRRFNVNLSDAAVRAKAVELGLAATKATVDDYGKAQGRLAIIMEQTDAAQGDFARTADGYANSTRTAKAAAEDFQAALGQAMLPVLEKVVGKGNEMLAWFNNLDPATQSAISSTALYSTGLLLLVGGLSTTIGALIKMRANLVEMRKAMVAMRLSSAAATAGIAALAVGVIWGIAKLREMNTAVLRLNDDALLRMKNRSNDLRETLDKQTGAVTDATTAYLQQEIAALGLEHAFNQAGIQADGLTEAFTSQSVSVGNSGGVMNEALIPIHAWIEANDDADKSMERAFGTLRSGLNDAIELGPTTGDVLADLGDEAGDAADEIADLDEAFADLVKTFLESSDSHITTAALLEDIIAAADGVAGMSFSEARREADDLAANFAEAVGDMVTEGAKIEEIKGFSNEAKSGIEAFAVAAGFSADETDRLRRAMDLIDGKVVSAQIALSIANPGVAEIIDGRPSGVLEPTGPPITVHSTVVMPDGQVLAEVVSDAERGLGGQLQ